MIFKTVFFLIVLRFFVIVIVVALYCGMHKTLNVWRCGVFMAFEIYVFIISNSRLQPEQNFALDMFP